MLSCRDLAHRHVSDYVDGQLGWRARMGVRFHLMLCDNCRRFIAQLRKVHLVLRKKSENIAAPDATMQELATKLSEIYRQQKNESQKKSSPPL